MRMQMGNRKNHPHGHAMANRAEARQMQRDYSEIGLWKDVPKAQWEDWRWQVSHRVVTEETLEQILQNNRIPLGK